MLTIEDGRRVLAQQPFSVLLGTELTVCGDGVAQLELEVSDRLRQQNGFVHGGVVSYLADNALTYAGGLALGPAVVTAEYKINYLRPALGERLIAKATVLHAGKTQAVVRCDISIRKKGDETLCAAAQGTIAKLPDAARTTTN
ncbi:MAG TPA: PaaI family thioesterase [Stenotrophobium sp.]|nr:PaaI family thioesterase [Stenotrophobium sp.]